MALRPRKVILMGAGGREFHDFNVAFRDDTMYEVVAFTAADPPHGERRRYPAMLAGPRYPNGIPIWPEERLAELIRGEWVDEVVLVCSDLAHEEVMHRASAALAAGADFRLLGPRATTLRSRKPVVAVCAIRPSSSTSPAAARVEEILREAGLHVVVVRQAQDSRGSDFAEILRWAEDEADVIVWDGGDFPFFEPRLLVTVVDPVQADDELAYHPGEAILRLADVVIVTNVCRAFAPRVDQVLRDLERVNPTARVVFAELAIAPNGSEPTVRNLELRELGAPALEEVIEPLIAEIHARQRLYATGAAP